jgi:hypothetical protein
LFTNQDPGIDPKSVNQADWGVVTEETRNEIRRSVSFKMMLDEKFVETMPQQLELFTLDSRIQELHVKKDELLNEIKKYKYIKILHITSIKIFHKILCLNNKKIKLTKKSQN